MKLRSRVQAHLLLTLTTALCACSSGGGDEPPPGGGLTQGEVLAKIQASASVDSDADFLPDDVEAFLGTNPNDRDTDHDGLPDYVEILGPGSAQEATPIADLDQDGKVAAADADDDGDGANDGMQVDSDGDGIANFLEYYGYTYNWMTGQYAAWDGDPAKRYFKSDPLQRSTDQDPFDDGVEATGVNMDVSVAAPGHLPMVPACPNVIVRLEGYSVALNQEITTSTGSTLAQGTEWQRTAESSFTHGVEKSFDRGVGAKIGLSAKEGWSGEINGFLAWGDTTSDTSGTSVSTSSGGSILTEQSWSSASSMNPSDAARMKLFLKVRNEGSAVASNVVPTIAVNIGGHNVATLQRAEAPIIILEPGSVYPASPGVYWVVDAVPLTLAELKALESGAPVSVTVTQVAADVMLRDPATGAYESAGGWSEYMARIRAVSASVIVDKGDGNVVRASVYADGKITSPVVTLGDALVWTAGAREDPVTGEVFVSYRDQATGAIAETSLAGWEFVVDLETLAANGVSSETPDGYDVVSLRLLPGSVVLARAPRSAVPRVNLGPTIHSAYYDPALGTVNAVVVDYDGVTSVQFRDKDGLLRPMAKDVPGSAFHAYSPAEDWVTYPSGYEFSGNEQVVATNADGQAAYASFVKVYRTPAPAAPSISVVWIDETNSRLYARIPSGIPLDVEPAFARVYGSMFYPGIGTLRTGALSFGDGYCQMKRVPEWWDPAHADEWVCDLALGTTRSSLAERATVVAWAGPLASAQQEITSTTPLAVTNDVVGRGRLSVSQKHSDPNLFSWSVTNQAQYVQMADLDRRDADYWRQSWAQTSSDYALGSTPTIKQVAGLDFAWYEVWLRIVPTTNHDDWGTLWFVPAVTAEYLGTKTDPEFDQIRRDEISIRLSSPTLTRAVPLNIGLWDRHVFVYQTKQGRYGKIMIQADTWQHGDFTATSWLSGHGITGAINYKYVTFDP